MLESIDILIGLSLVMLVASLATMLITQALLELMARRGHHLLCGLTDLLTQLHPDLKAGDAKTIADAVVSHPLVRGSARRTATVVKREEFIKLLFELSAKAASSAATPPLAEGARQTLENVLRQNGVSDPAQTLSNVRMFALELERTHPELATAARHTIALTQEARSEFVAKVNAWFDQTMDRVTERFTFSSRAFAMGAAVLVVLVTQLDTFAVVNRLAVDDAFRSALVQEAVRLDAAQASQKGGGTNGANAAQPASAAQTPSKEEQQRLLRVMQEHGILQMPNSFAEWTEGWSTVSPGGVLISVLLLSLGAPFWFNALSALLRLRSVVAVRDDADRTDRQSDTRGRPAGASSSSTAGTQTDPSASSTVVGERGDLAAVG